jgi:serine/threonine protein kinase
LTPFADNQARADEVMQLGSYQIVRRLAVGGMAEIYLATQGDQRVVIKRLLPDLADDPEQVEMFLQEARIAETLDHPNVVRVFGHGNSDGALYIVMEHIAGVDLRRILAISRRHRIRLPAGISISLLLDVCEGLDYVHSRRDASGRPLNLIHRDVTPSNIVVSYQGIPKLVDFGIVKASIAPARTGRGLVKGKVPYLSPEQILERTVDARVDLWSLGVVLFELLEGRRPFDTNTDIGTMMAILKAPVPPLSSTRRGSLAGFDAVVRRALERDPARRYESASRMAQDLEAWLPRFGGRVDSAELGSYVQKLCTDDFDRALADEMHDLAPGVDEPRSNTEPTLEIEPVPAVVAAHRPQRRFPRLPVSFEVEGQWWSPDTSPDDLRADVLWISEGGVMLRCAAPVRANATVSFSLTRAPRELSLDLKGTVRWWRRAGALREIGVCLDAPVPALGRYVAKHLPAG